MKKIILYSVFCILPSAVFAQPGSLDNSFGTGGIVTTDLGGYFGDYGLAVAIQSDGKIVVVGDVDNDPEYCGLIRYNSNGTLDNSFGTGSPVGDQYYSVAIQSDGKIVVAGNHYNGDYDFALVRYNSDGSLDNTFDSDGIVTTDFGSSYDFGYSVAVQSNGKIVVAGYSGDYFYYDFALVRYNSDGSLDNTFDSDGKVTTDLGNSRDKGYSVVIQNDGKIVVAGNSGDFSYSDFALVRYNSDGSLDNTFDYNGKLTTGIGSVDVGKSVALQSDGKIVVAGYSGDYSDSDFALVRYNSDGSLDNTFDSDGKVTTDLGSSEDIGYSVAIQSDDKILVGGYCYNGSPTYYDFALVRYNNDGTLDNTFDIDGKVLTDFGNSSDRGHSVAIQSDGKILVAGDSNYNGSNQDFAVVRYNGDGSSGIEENTAMSDVSIYPNPVRDYLVIEHTGNIGGSIHIMDVTGRVLIEENMQTDRHKIEMKGLAAGIYLLEADNKNGTMERMKFIRME